jgi:hypothetical protein
MPKGVATMENGLKELLENELLSEDTKTAFLEAWNNKINEVKASLREEVETQIREEFSNRYEQDKNNLVEAMDNMLTDSVKKYATETFEAAKALKEERARLTKAIKETRVAYKAKVAEHQKVLESFVLGQLGKEIKDFSNDQRAVMAQRVLLAKQIREAKGYYKNKVQEHTGKLQNFVLAKLNEELKSVKVRQEALAESKIQHAKKLNEHRKSLNEQAADRVNKLEAFVIEQLSKEINDFKQDKNALVEMRVKMASEAKSKLDETKKAFIERASKLVETTVEKQLRKEMTQLKEDIRSSRENIFGRRLFEAFQVEYMTSYLSEGTQIKKLNTKLSEAQKKLDEAVKVISTQKQLNEQAQRKVALSEERATRVKTLNELLRPLNREKREVMENLLETVKTTSLKEAFQKYLPAVLNESAKQNTQGRRLLSEIAPSQQTNNAQPKRTIAVTGNRINRLIESTQTETQDQSAEIIELRRLAGIEK